MKEREDQFMNDNDFVELPNIITGPKLTWFLDTLERNKIPYQVQEYRPLTDLLHKVFIPFGKLASVKDILQSVIAHPNNLAPIRVMDLPNHHLIFLKDTWSHLNNIVDKPRENGTAYIGPSEIVNIPIKGQSYQVEMFDVVSTNVSAMGFAHLSKGWSCFTRFKGGGNIYAYTPVEERIVLDLSTEIRNKNRNLADASVGTMFHKQVRSRADRGELTCLKYDIKTGIWSKVVAKQ